VYLQTGNWLGIWQRPDAGESRTNLMSLTWFVITNVNTFNCSIERRSPEFIVWPTPDQSFVEGQRVLAAEDSSGLANTALVDK